MDLVAVKVLVYFIAIAILLRRFYFIRLHYYLLQWRIHYAALKRFEIYDSTAVDSNEVDYSSESSSSEADW